MTDRYENIRKALEMGPTPGPWSINTAGRGVSGKIVVDEIYIYNPAVADDVAIAADIIDPETGEPSEANARLIAACDPSTIHALLAERDDLLENGNQAIRWAPSSANWSNELKRLFGDDARLGIDALESQLRNAQAKRDALRDALETIAAYPYSRDQEMGATAMRKVARDALAAATDAAMQARKQGGE